MYQFFEYKLISKRYLGIRPWEKVEENGWFALKPIKPTTFWLRFSIVWIIIAGFTAISNTYAMTSRDFDIIAYFEATKSFNESVLDTITGYTGIFCITFSFLTILTKIHTFSVEFAKIQFNMKMESDNLENCVLKRKMLYCMAW